LQALEARSEGAAEQLSRSSADWVAVAAAAGALTGLLPACPVNKITERAVTVTETAQRDLLGHPCWQGVHRDGWGQGEMKVFLTLKVVFPSTASLFLHKTHFAVALFCFFNPQTLVFAKYFSWCSSYVRRITACSARDVL